MMLANVDAATVITSVLMFVAMASAVLVGARPLAELVARQEQQFDTVLRGNLLLSISPRMATVASGVLVAMIALGGLAISESLYGALLAGILGAMVPGRVLAFLKRRRLGKLESQLVTGIQTLASGVRAGLNLVQSMTLVARDGPIPLRQEFAHLLREYEYGVPLDEAMDKSAARIGSGDFRLLFAALQTHRERGGDLGETLDRIADAIREIQRLEGRVKTLTAQGRANARMMGMLVVVSMGILYFLVDPQGVRSLFIEDAGKVILAVIFLLNVAGFLWIKKIVSIDI
jgi:tight adherence protein B